MKEGAGQLPRRSPLLFGNTLRRDDLGNEAVTHAATPARRRGRATVAAKHLATSPSDPLSCLRD